MENKIENVWLIDLNDIVMSENIQEPKDDHMTIKEDKIDKIIRKGIKRKNKFAGENFRKK